MSLKTDFNNQISLLFRGVSKSSIHEKCLLHALLLSLNTHPSVVGSIIHGKCVSFPVSKVLTARRELCDILIVQIFKGYIRYSFIQTKRQTQNTLYKGLSTFDIDCYQHQLLINRPVISSAIFWSNILSTCKLETATAYSVFYMDTNGDVDFDFSSAKLVECNHCGNTFSSCASRHSARHLKTSLSFLPSPHIEYNAIQCCDDIERYREFGEIINFDNLSKSEFWRFVSCFNEVDKFIEVFRDISDLSNLTKHLDSINSNTSICDVVGSVVFIDNRDRKKNEQ